MNKINSHSYSQDKRNQNIKIYINGKYYDRIDAKISVLDSGFLLGDGVWESFRLHNGHLCFINDHLNRLYSGAKSINIDIGLSKDKLLKIINQTIEKNMMYTNVHIRLIVSRGLKQTPYQHPDANIGPSSIVVIPEYKTANSQLIKSGLTLTTVKIIRGNKYIQDPNINSISKFNCIAACIEADNKGANEALMLDLNNNVSTCNSTNFFMISKNRVITSTGKYCLKGITRQNIIKICKSNNITVIEKNFPLNDVFKADEAFVTGTFAGVIPVVSLNNKLIGGGGTGPLTIKLYNLYKETIESLYPKK